MSTTAILVRNSSKVLDLYGLNLYNGYMTKRKGFWGKFDDLMDALPDYINSEVNNSTSISQRKTETVSIPGMSFSSNTSEINQDGRKIVIKTKNKLMTITVNGKVVYKETKK